MITNTLEVIVETTFLLLNVVIAMSPILLPVAVVLLGAFIHEMTEPYIEEAQ